MALVLSFYGPLSEAGAAEMHGKGVGSYKDLLWRRLVSLLQSGIISIRPCARVVPCLCLVLREPYQPLSDLYRRP